MNRRVFFFAGILALGLPVWLAAGCRGRIENEASKKIKPLLPDYIGPAEKYDVQVKGDSSGALMRGHIHSVHIDGRKVLVDPSLILDRLTLDFEEVSVDTKERRLKNIGQATFHCRIQSRVLDEYVRRRRPDVADLKLELRADTLFISARPDALGLVEKPLHIDLPGKIPVPITVEGKLQPRPGSRLDFVPEQAKVTIVPIPEIALDYLQKKINPVIDLSTMRIPIQPVTTVVRGEYLYITGTIRPDDIIKMQ